MLPKDWDHMDARPFWGGIDPDHLSRTSQTTALRLIQADTRRDAIIWFADFDHCRQFIMELRWPEGVVKCPRCGAAKVTYLKKQRVWKCYAKHVSPTFSLKPGTIFEDSPIALEKWLCAAW